MSRVTSLKKGKETIGIKVLVWNNGNQELMDLNEYPIAENLTFGQAVKILQAEQIERKRIEMENKERWNW